MSRSPGLRRPAGVEEEFASARERLIAVAYGITGDRGAAEDVVQEAWLRLASVPGPIDDVTGWLVVATSRLALDVVRSARHRRERYVGPWLPEPLVEADTDPADRVTLDESVTMALLVVLETLSPAERTVFVLHEVFGVPFAEVAGVVGRDFDGVSKHMRLLREAGLLEGRLGEDRRFLFFYMPERYRRQPGWLDFGICTVRMS